jgi:arylsulfatase A-like enzyme
VVKGYFSLIDLFPSIASFIGIDAAPYQPNGRTVKLSGLKQLRNTYIFSANMFKRSVQDSRYKLVVTYLPREHRSRTGLYRLAEDPMEMHNVADEFPEEANILQALLQDHERQIGASPSGTNPNPLTDQAMSAVKLKALGYIAQ